VIPNQGPHGTNLYKILLSPCEQPNAIQTTRNVTPDLNVIPPRRGDIRGQNGVTRKPLSTTQTVTQSLINNKRERLFPLPPKGIRRQPRKNF
jgi:hypothetical protein